MILGSVLRTEEGVEGFDSTVDRDLAECFALGPFFLLLRLRCRTPRCDALGEPAEFPGDLSIRGDEADRPVGALMLGGEFDAVDRKRRDAVKALSPLREHPNPRRLRIFGWAAEHQVAAAVGDHDTEVGDVKRLGLTAECRRRSVELRAQVANQ